MRKLKVVVSVFAIVALAAMSASAQTNRIFFSNMADGSDGGATAITVPAFVPTNFYILAEHDGTTSGGVNGAEFRVKGKPAAGLILNATASPASNVALGDPFSDETQAEGSRGGTNIAFPTCQTSSNNSVLLYTVQAIMTVDMEDILLEVDKKDPPSNMVNGNFSLINACDAPVFTAIQAAGGVATINPGTAVENASWSAVKQLFD